MAAMFMRRLYQDESIEPGDSQRGWAGPRAAAAARGNWGIPT